MFGSKIGKINKNQKHYGTFNFWATQPIFKKSVLSKACKQRRWLPKKFFIDKRLRYSKTIVPHMCFDSSLCTKTNSRNKIKKPSKISFKNPWYFDGSYYCLNMDIKTSVTVRVGVVGLRCVGKSSLINSLKRSKACQIGSTA